MRITKEQEAILDEFTCERLSSNPANHSLIQNFQNKRGQALVQYFLELGWKLDQSGENAFYIVKNPQGIPCLFFALKCGALYTPLDEEKVQHRFAFAQHMLHLINSAPDNDPDKIDLMIQIEEARQTHNIPIEEILERISSNAKAEKTKHEDYLLRLASDRQQEGERPIQRVAATLPGVEMTHFCTNDLAKDDWKKYDFRFPMGEVLFWKFIAPIILKLQALVGCQYVFLFAADSTPDGTLTNYYNVSLKFSKLSDVGTSKPAYDWCCEFMSQEIRNLFENMNSFFENFNLDPEVEAI